MSKNDGDDFSGFEDFLKSQTQPTPQRRAKTIKRDNGAPELVTFIEDEINRLSKLSEFFEQKLRNSILYSQTEELIKKQKEHNRRCKSKLNEKLRSPSSEFQGNLKILFEAHFKDLS